MDVGNVGDLSNPAAYVGGVMAHLGITVVWTAMILDWAARGGIVSWRFRRLSLAAVRL
jgi:Na+-driven multidrug efflux pump